MLRRPPLLPSFKNILTQMLHKCFINPVLVCRASVTVRRRCVVPRRQPLLPSAKRRFEP